MISTKPKLSLGSFISEDDLISISEFMNHPQFKNPVDANDRKRVIKNTLETMLAKAKNPNETRGRKKKQVEVTPAPVEAVPEKNKENVQV